MGERLKQATVHNTWFWILMVTAILMLAVAFALPPTAIIDKSILAAVGELAGFAGIGTVIKALDMGVDAKVKHNNTEVTVGNLDEKE